jgi:hypothetical protein
MKQIIPQVHLKNRKLSLLANIGVQIGIFVLLTVLTAGAGEAFSAFSGLGALADAATGVGAATGVRAAVEAGEEGVEMVGVRAAERTAVEGGGGAARVHVGVGPAGGGGGGGAVESPMVGVSSTEEGGAQGGVQGEFKIGRAPTIKDRLDLAKKRFAGLKKPAPKDWHLTVYSALKQDPALKGNIEAQLDYLEENGFRDMNPPRYGKQYKPITTRAQAREILEAMEKRSAKNIQRMKKWVDENPVRKRELDAKKNSNRTPIQKKIHYLRKKLGRNGFLSPEDQAELEELMKQREAESLAKSDFKASQQALRRMFTTGEEDLPLPRKGVFPSSAAEGGGGGGGFTAAAPGVAPTGEDADDDIDDIDDIEEDL